MCRKLGTRSLWVLLVLTILCAMTGNGFAQNAAGIYTYAFPKVGSAGNSGFIFANLGDQPTRFDGTFYSADGKTTQFVYFEGQPGIVARVSADDLKNLGVSDFSGGVVFNSTFPMSITASIGDPNSSNFENINPATRANRLVLPFSQGTFGEYEISVFNAENGNTSIIVAAIDPTGATLGTAQRTLPPHGSIRETLTGMIPGVIQAGTGIRRDVSHVLVFTPANILGADRQLYAVASLSSYANGAEGVIGRLDTGIVNAVPSDSASFASTIPYFVQGGAYFSMVQVINNSSSGNFVTLTARDENGNLLAASRNPATFGVAAGGSIRLNINNIFNFTDLAVAGFVTVTSTTPTIVTSAIGTNAQRGFELSPTVASGETNIVFPTRNLGREYYDGYALRNPNAFNATVTLRYILDGGIAVSRFTRTLQAGGALIRTLIELFPEATANGFVLVQSDLPILSEAITGRVDGTELTRIPPMRIQPGYRVPDVQRFIVTGRITHNGSPLVGAGIQLTGGVNFSGVADAAGTFTFENIPKGTYTLKPQLNGYTFSPAQSTINIVDDSSRGNNFLATLSPPAITSINPTGVVVGSSATALTLMGGPFLSTTVVYFEGNALQTVVGTTAVAGAGTGVVVAGGTSGIGAAPSSGGVSTAPNTLTATLIASQLLVARTGTVFAVSFGPGGPAISAPITFSIGTPAPIITSTSGVPNPLVAGHAAFVLTLRGSGFIRDAVAKVSGSVRNSFVQDSGTMFVDILASDLALGGNYSVIITNPEPTVGPSNTVTVSVSNPVPGLFTISPSTAQVRLETNAASLPMTVDGFGFRDGATVRVGGINVPTTYVNSTRLTAAIQPEVLQVGGIAPITVSNPAPTLGSSEALPLLLTNLTPVLNSFVSNPLIFDAGRPTETYVSQIILRGNNFSPVSVVDVGLPCAGGSPLAAGSSSRVSTQEIILSLTISCTGTYGFRVRTPQPGGGTSQILGVTVTAYTQPVPPTITSLSPSSVARGSGETPVTIAGTGFASDAVVNFGTAILTPVAVSGTSIVVRIPAFLLTNSGVFPVSVTNTNTTGSSNRLNFTIP